MPNAQHCIGIIGVTNINWLQPDFKDLGDAYDKV